MAKKQPARKSGSPAKSRKSKAIKKSAKKPAPPKARAAAKRAARPLRKAAPAAKPRPAKKAPPAAKPALQKKSAPGVARGPAAKRGPGGKAAFPDADRQTPFDLEMEPPISEMGTDRHTPLPIPPPRKRGRGSPSDADYPGESLTVGMEAPDFSLPSTEGRPISLSEFRGKLVVLYFYPKDDTPGCTMEACAFRDSMGRIQQKGAVVLGVSLDDELSHDRFRMKYNLNFPLLADRDAAISRKYGTYKEKSLYGRSFWGIERTTFVIDREGKVEHVFRRVKVEGHAEEVMATLAG